ncbi:shikimate dehydrogenase [Hirschia litorea]|uniref:Shikimate dehydrogenase (NADP(+)) n=1 Tax=Hirschia litorea TaxID=1199156 RepID=A0ABW2INA1_9PROT
MNAISNTQVYGVIGDPIAQSLSPDIHNRWIKSAEIDAYYNKFHLQTNSAKTDIQTLYRFGVKGLNITMPYKESAIQAAYSVSETAKIIGVANTLKATPEGWQAENTDAVGFLNALLECLEETNLKDKRILLIGAGGAARAVAYILNKQGADLTIANRTVEKAQSLISELAPQANACGLSLLAEKMKTSEIVINATSLKAGIATNLEFPQGQNRLFYDLSYGQAPKPVLAKASFNGWKTQDGLRMLVEQAALAYQMWHGDMPDVNSAFRMCLQKVN